MPIEGTLYNCKLRDNPSLSAQCAAGGACSQEFGVPGTRNLTVYVPAAYTNGEEVGVMVTQDGEIPMVRNIMDHLVGAKDPERSLPTFVYISVQLAGPGKPNSLTHRPVLTPRSRRYRKLYSRPDSHNPPLPLRRRAGH